MKEEPVDILDGDGNKIGKTLLKSQAHKKGLWHGAAHLWVYNSKCEVVLQLRHPNKVVAPNIWDVSAAGHIVAGKEPREMAIEEAEEELGLKVDSSDVKFIGKDRIQESMENGKWTHKVIIWVYATEMDVDLDDLTLEEGETSDVKWMSLKQLEEELQDLKLQNMYSATRQSYDIAIKRIPELLKNV